jgi:hypothetical protein
MYLDYTNAFGLANYDILVRKLSNCGVFGKTLDWFDSYLRNRKIIVRENDNLSKFF